MAEAVSISYTGGDSRGGTKPTKIHVPQGFTLAQYSEFAIAMGQLIANVMDGRVESISVTVPLTTVGAVIKGAANAGADIAERFVTMFRGAIAGVKKLFRIPTMAQSTVIAGSDNIDTSIPAVASLLSMVTTGIAVTGGTLNFTDNRSNDLTTNSYARKGTDETV